MCQETNSSMGFSITLSSVFYLIILVNMVIIKSQGKF